MSNNRIVVDMSQKLLSRVSSNAKHIKCARGVSTTTTKSVHLQSQPQHKGQNSEEAIDQETKKLKKTTAQIDEELRMKMAGLAGDGGESGLELEDGKPISMKRSVRDNMFRYI